MSKKVNSAQVSTKEAHSQTSSEPQLHISHLSTSDLSTEATDDTVPSSYIFFTFSKDKALQQQQSCVQVPSLKQFYRTFLPSQPMETDLDSGEKPPDQVKDCNGNKYLKFITLCGFQHVACQSDRDVAKHFVETTSVCEHPQREGGEQGSRLWQPDLHNKASNCFTRACKVL